MIMRDKALICVCAIVLSILYGTAGQRWTNNNVDYSGVRNKTLIIWCTVSREEQQKCRNFAMANERDKIAIGYEQFRIECYFAFNKDDCMALIDEGKATVTTLDAGEVFVGGRLHSLVPIAQEVSEGGFNYVYSVAMVKKNTLTDVTSLRDLRGKRACFAGVGLMAGWVLPIYTLMKEGDMQIIDCNNHVKSAINFFGPSCAVNALIDKYNPIGDNSDKLCSLCVGPIPGGRCSDSDPYAGYEGAFRCLLEAGDIAFLKHTTAEELMNGLEFGSVPKDHFELLCKDGSRQPISEYRSCNWGTVPSNAIVSSSAMKVEMRMKVQKFLNKAAEIYSNSTSSSGTNRQDYNNQNNQFGDRNRFKRQTYDNRNPYNPNDPYGKIDNPNDPYGKIDNTNNPYGKTDNTNNPFGTLDNRRDQFDTTNRNNPFDRNNQNDPYGRTDNTNDLSGRNDRKRPINRYNPNDPFGYIDPYRQDFDARDPYDPYLLNPNQYGENIDPYSTNREIQRDRNRKFNQSYEIPIYNDTSADNTFFEVFNLFESSPRFGIHHNLLFQDTTRRFLPLTESQQTYAGYLGKSLDVIMGVRDCPVNRMTLCVTSDTELEKCIKMRTALNAQLLKPEMVCHKAHSQINCMQAITSGVADVAVFDASDVYTAGLHYDLAPFISEIYNLGEPEYYVVAVAKEDDPDTELTYLKGKNTCHGGINTAAGWVYPLAYLISNGWIRDYGCNSIRAAAEYFTKSCAPGALSTEYNTGVPYDNMCDLCHGVSHRFCRRDASEDYYGHSGAFRCLVEGGGDVAFVKHTTVNENTGGKRREWWARDALLDDFELLCPDGTRAEITDYKRCNLGKAKANAVVTRGGYGYNETQINSYINLFLYAQTFYGRKLYDEFSFSMFDSTPPATDLIFQDATTQLQVIPTDKRHYSAYLGSDYMRARRITDCYAGAASLIPSFIIAIPIVIFAFCTEF